ncbi:hypothetical protein ACFQE5_21670 [Pseudonocardia hispaniensis]|uniref:Uncharacterized protein n=1 Tax=Pseudonocardia hispaniensis TaxID=904933 RepID=A0ABW1J7G6_9PSEU
MRWLDEGAVGRARWLRLAELSITTAAVGLGAAGIGAPAGLAVAAVQNALITQFAAMVLGAAIGARVSAGVVGSGAAWLLLASPGLPNAPWLLVDMLTDPQDWLVLVPLAALAVGPPLAGRRRRCGTSGP